MLPEVGEESITAPPPHDFHGFYGQARKQVEERGADTYAVPLQRLQVSFLGGRRQAFDERGFGKGTKSTLVLICEEMGVWGWAVYPSMILQGSVWVCGPRMSAPVYVLAFERGCLGVWKVEDSDLEAVRVSVNANVVHRDMKEGGKGV